MQTWVAKLDEGDVDPLLAAYLERRGELLGYFRVRLRSLQAAEDLVQDIYLKIIGRQPEDIRNPAAYLYRLGSNLMLDRIKQEQRVRRKAAAWRHAHANDDGSELAAEEPLADDAVIARQRLQRIVEAVRELPAPVVEAFRLHKLEGLSHAETAEAMGVSRSSVEKYLMTSLKHILKRVGR